MEKKSSRGGSRPGAGRPIVAPPTETKTIRIPLEDIAALQAAGITNISRFYVEAGSKAIKRLKK